jgi:hypothetical protein
LGSFFIEDFLSSLLSSSIGDLNSVVVENVVHDVVFVSTEVSRAWGIGGSWSTLDLYGLS